MHPVHDSLAFRFRDADNMVKITRKLCGLIVLAVLLPLQSFAGVESFSRQSFPPQPLKLKQAIEYGLEHNRTLLSAKQQVHATNQQVGQARADFYPRLDGQYTFQHLKDEPIAKFFEGEEFPINHATTNRWQVDVTQPLFAGFGLTAQLNISKMDLRIAEHRLEETRLDVVRDVQKAFLQVLLAEKLVQVVKDNVQSLEVQRRNAEAQFQQGLTAQNDVLKADVALAQAQQRERTTVKQLVLLRSRLNQLLDLAPQTKLALAESEVSMPPRGELKLEELYGLADQQRPELLSLEVSIRQAEESIRGAKSKYYPHLSAFARYYREGEDFMADRNDFLNNDNAAVGLRIDWNWFEGGKTAAEVKEFRYRQRALEERREDLLHQVHLQVEDAFEQLSVARANIETAKTALVQAEENERMVTLQYKEQLVIFLEVLNAQVFLLQSRVDYYEALYGYQLAMSDLERAVGGSFE
jgi:outer membrane protein TolC